MGATRWRPLMMHVLGLAFLLVSLPAQATASSPLLSLWQDLRKNNLSIPEAQKYLEKEESEVHASQGALTPSLSLRSGWVRSGQLKEDVLTALDPARP